jgi:iron complex outermembrane receptor protein
MRYILLTLLSAVLSCSIVFAEEAKKLEEVVVTSTTIDDRFEAKRDEPSNISVISGEKVDKSHAENILQILNSIPGVTGELQSGDSLKIMLRGIENQRFMGEKPGVAIVIDGVPVFERTGRVNIDLDNIESIKVIKGGASYLFGEDALSGAVIITTKRGAKMAGYRVEAEAGSFEYYKGMARAGLAGEKFTGHLQISKRQSDGYHFQSDYSAAYLNGKLQYHISGNSDIAFGFEFSERTKDSHGTVTGVTQAKNDPKSIEGRDYSRMYDVGLSKFFLQYSIDSEKMGDLLLNIYQFADHTEFKSSPQRFTSTGATVTDVDAYTTGNDYKQVQRGVKGEWRKGGKTTAGMVGLDLRNNTYDNFNKYLVNFRTKPAPPTYYAGTVVADNETDEKVAAIYGELKHSLIKALTLTGNGRYDHIKLDYKDAKNSLRMGKSFDVYSGRLGANYALSDNMDIYTNVSTGFRAPTVEQLFAGSISPTGGVSNNPDLKPETALNYEIGIRNRFRLFGVEMESDVALFQIDRKDFIIASGGQYSSADKTPITDQYKNIGGVRNRGLELSLRTDQKRKVSADIAYTYIDAKFTGYHTFYLTLGPRGSETTQLFDNTGNKVPRVPNHRLNLTTRYRPVKDLVISGELNAISSYYADEINRVRIAGHGILNLLVNYDLKKGDKNVWSFFARVDNVLDKFYYNTARGHYDANGDNVYNAEDVSITVNPGRVWTVGLTVTF